MSLRRFLPFMVMVLLTAGTYAGDDEPTRFFFEMVRVPGAEYWVAKYPVTQKQYAVITGETPSRFVGDDNPVDSVSWDDAVAFCEKLTARERAAGRLPAGFVYDLPSDAQWDQFAAGTGLKDAEPSHDDLGSGTRPVSAGKPNALGLYGVVGSVWEWCRDWYNNDIRRKDANPDLPAALAAAEAPASGPEETYKVLRGGAWDTGLADHFTLASRLRYAPGMSNYRTGFRCVVERAGSALSR